MQNTIKNKDTLNNNFVYGMGSFFNLFNKEHKKCFNIAENNNFYFHSSISYTGSSFFYKRVSKKKKSNDKKLILKIAGYSLDQLKYEIEESINEFDLDELYGFQLWEKLPNLNRNIDFKELNKIIYFLEELKKHNIIKKTFFQLEPNKFNFDEIDFFDGYAFYGYPNELQLEKNHFVKIFTGDKIFLQFQFFGGRSTKKFRDDFMKENSKIKNLQEIDKLWIENCLSFTNKTFPDNCLYVGCTQKSIRLEYLSELINNKTNLRINDHLKSLNFSNNLKYLHQVNYPIGNHPYHLKRARSKWTLLKLYIKKLLKI